MRYYGQFRNVKNELIAVQITNGAPTPVVEITRQNGIWFSSDPVQIESDVENTFEHLLRKSCTINLITRDYIGKDLFADNAKSVDIKVKNEDKNEFLFQGYLEPNTFNQGFAMPLEEFSLNCVDFISTLQYEKYNGTTPDNYEQKKKSAKLTTFKEMLTTMFEGIDGTIYYDGSKGISANRTTSVFDDLAITETFIYGDDYDDCWTAEDVLNEMLKYLNLHIIQNGLDFYIFDWDSIVNKNTIWHDIINGGTIIKSANEINLTSSMHSADDTNITISEVYNQIAVKDDVEKMELVIQSPLDSKSLTSLYSGKQLYMTEYISEGSGDDAHDAMIDMLNHRTSNYKEASKTDWYLQVMKNPNWNMYLNNSATETVDTICETDGNKYINQWKVSKYLKEHQLTPCILRLGNVKQDIKVTDNSPINKLDMKNYLYISVNGNEEDGESTHSPTDTTLANAQPILEYVGNNSGGVFSPADDETINYLVFSGEMLLQPIAYESGVRFANRYNSYIDILRNGMWKSEGSKAYVPHYDGVTGISNLVKSDNNKEGRYYVRKFWTTTNPTDKPLTYLTDGSCGIQPWTEDKSAKGYKYNYCAKGDGTDKFSKLPILECELIIGDKRLIETDMDEYGNSTFQWVKLGEEPYEDYVDSDGTTKRYQVTTFSLGVNPKIQDYIIGTEFDIQNTIDYTMNVDAEGTAIPIKKSDAVSGAVHFKILGPVNSLWNDITRRHPTFFWHTKYYETARFVLAHTENIIIKDFECKIYTDNGGNDITDDNDIIYMSDETHRYINKKDDIDFKFVTQLSSRECAEKGISNTINMNSVVDYTTKLHLTSLYNALNETTAKPEELYVDQYYRQYSTPKIIMEATMHNADNISMSNLYNSTVLNKKFFIQSMNFDVKMDNKQLTFKEL